MDIRLLHLKLQIQKWGIKDYTITDNMQVIVRDEINLDDFSIKELEKLQVFDLIRYQGNDNTKQQLEGYVKYVIERKKNI